MSRPLRIEYGGAWYHVMNRGLAKQTIFHNEKSHQLFLNLLDEAHHRYQIQIHAYCLMKNHYHLLVHTPLPNLGRAMRLINSLYTVKNNRLIGRDGPLFRGRYKAILVDADNYLLELSRYIHLNPCAAKISKMPEDYRWSSYKYFLGKSKPNWVYCNTTLNHFGLSKISSYRKFVMSGLRDEPVPLKKGKFSILGSDDFVEKIKNEKLFQTDIQEIPEQINFMRNFYPTSIEIMNAVANYFNITSSNVLNGLARGCLIRNIAIYLCYQLTGSSFKLLSKEFKGLSNWSLSKISRKIELLIKTDTQLLADINLIKKSFSNFPT